MIDLFDTLFEQFSAQYATSQPHHMTSGALINLQQANNDFMAQFS